MENIIVKLLVAGGVMGVLDFVWLKFIANNYYRDHLGKLLLDKPNMFAAVLFYIIYVVGIVVFVVNPALEKGSGVHAAAYGAFFGLVAYATYDLTNLATVKGFSTNVVIVDLLWGAMLTAAVSVVTFWIVS